jgi:hypothetical protein
MPKSATALTPRWIPVLIKISEAAKIDLLSGDDPASDLGRDVIYTNIGPSEWQAAIAR